MLKIILNGLQALRGDEPSCRDIMLHPQILAMTERERADLPISAGYYRPMADNCACPNP